MSNFVDAIKRPLFIPPRFMSYLEKHKVYELFRELAKQLIIDQPDDHILYLKQCLEHAIRKRDVPRIILIAPPTLDKMALAAIFQNKLGLRPITLKDLREKFIMKKNCLCNEAENLAMNMRKLLQSGILHDSGWILIDVPRTKREARAFQHVGIIPTHVFQIIISNDLDKNHMVITPNYYLGINDSHSIDNDMEMQAYRKNLRGLLEVYANCLIEVERGIRSIEELGNDCVALTKVKKHSGVPSLFRIVLIGSRGSGCRTIAKYLAKKYNLVHVNFDYIMEQTRIQLTPMAECLRLFEEKWEQQPKPQIRIQVIDKYINSPECLNKGWVLTGYPINVEDFKLLDMIDSSPNKIIFIQVSADIRKERLLNRRYSVITGERHDFTLCADYRKRCYSELSVHPKDYVNVVTEHIRKFDNNVEEMLKYAGETVFMIDGHGDQISVIEKVESCLMQSRMHGKPRESQPLSMVDPRDVEFDPDDEPETNLFDEIIPLDKVAYTFI